jgi:hypothetical protein
VLAREMVVSPHGFSGIGDVLSAARQVKREIGSDFLS